MSYHNILEEELKNKVANDYFYMYDWTRIIGKVDFCISMIEELPLTSSQRGDVLPLTPSKRGDVSEQESLLWAEAKKGSSDIYKSIVQLILTIGKARTFDKHLPPPLLGALDADKIAFIPYNDIHDIFYQNDFNWTVAPSNHETKEFQLIYDKVKKSLDEKSLIFYYDRDDKQLKKFIRENFQVGKFGITKTKIDKNNFMVIYNKWLLDVKPTIAVNWDIAKKKGIIDGDFYLADLLSRENNTLKEKLFVLLKNDHYELDRKLDDTGMFTSTRTDFKDKQVAHTQFWNKYDRPPKEEYWDYIVERRDLLVPQDVRERKGSFFTPQIWVELSQKYLTDYLGENWQDEYYIWDCAAGTGNLLNGLTNKYHIFASTLDTQDVEVMKDRIKNGANLLDSHVFQFDFLNDDFFGSEGDFTSPNPSKGGEYSTSQRGLGRVSKLPKDLQDIILDEEKRKKLVIYINPPYAEASDKKTLKGIEGKGGVEQSNINTKYANLLGQGNAELFAQFFIRIYNEIPNCILAEFSKLKILQGQHFIDFRNSFRAKLEKLFIVQAETFDNVKGKFPIGFFIWNTQIEFSFKNIIADVYDKNGLLTSTKYIESYVNSQYINDWIKPYRAPKNDPLLLGKFPFKGNDFQNQNMISLVHPEMVYNKEAGQFLINAKNLINASIYFAVRHCIDATWLNDRDQFLFPNDGWKNDKEFQNDCFAFTLFSNNIQSKFGTNHWIPFKEQEVGAKALFESHFMTDFIAGKIKVEEEYNLFNPPAPLTKGEPLSADDSPSQRGLGGVDSQRGLEEVDSPRRLGGVDPQREVEEVITPEYLSLNNISTDYLIFSKYHLPYNPNLKDNSRKLRKSGNLSEVILWKELRADSFMGYSFHRQKPILNYIADFYCKELKLVIEIDGSSHDNEESIKYDAERDRQMQVLGLTILRVRDEDVKKDLTNVLRNIEKVVREFTPPNPLKEGETPPDPHSKEEFTPPSPFKEEKKTPSDPLECLEFSDEAKAVFDAGRELWKYYHAQPFPSSEGVSEGRGGYNVNASLYDIREHFQGRNDKGKMNNKSLDETYNTLITTLRTNLKILANKIEPKVYEYEFLNA